MKNFIRDAVAILVGFIVLWYAGAMFNFFPFLGGDASSAVGYTGLLLCVVILVCTGLILSEIKKNKP